MIVDGSGLKGPRSPVLRASSTAGRAEKYSALEVSTPIAGAYTLKACARLICNWPPRMSNKGRAADPRGRSCCRGVPWLV